MTGPDPSPAFRPGHVVPREGLPTWSAPDGAHPSAPLDPLLPVEVTDRRGDWARVLCSNGWSAWVDGRLLVSVPQAPPAAGRAPERTADPRPLLARVEREFARYRQAAEDLAAGHTDGQTFERRTGGLRVGLVVDGGAVWLYDAEEERWCYCDGASLTTYAPGRAPDETRRAPEGTEQEPYGTGQIPYDTGRNPYGSGSYGAGSGGSGSYGPGSGESGSYRSGSGSSDPGGSGSDGPGSGGSGSSGPGSHGSGSYGAGFHGPGQGSS
ncbi:hypothetical protein ACH429_13910 [Streptomyces pathocidini]|uniref:Uncharacterized protein n=1 Tax=Streptomyces pathocidini TaxID=1650571 RepID=A0ABW7UUT0_9ACTN|nr:hypothetical protein [Streptomyces pathocidini]